MSTRISTANLHVILQTLRYWTTSSVSFSGEHLWRYEQKNIAEHNSYTNSVLRSAVSIWTLLTLLDNTKYCHPHHELTTWRQAIWVLLDAHVFVQYCRFENHKELVRDNLYIYWMVTRSRVVIPSVAMPSKVIQSTFHIPTRVTHTYRG